MVVVGGGPVGLAAALYAAQAGLSCIVLEPRADPVDKACGEGLMPGGLAALAALGVDPPGRSFRGIRYVSAGSSAEADFRTVPGRGVRRTALHRALRDAVDRAGVEVVQVSAVDVVQSPRRVMVGTALAGRSAGPAVRGRYLLAADGLHSQVRRWVALDAAPRAPRRYGQRRHYGIPAWSDHVEVHWGPRGEAYVTPVADDLVGVAVLSRARAPYSELMEDFPTLRGRLTDAEPLTPVLGAGPMRQRSASRVAGRVLLVGDASGYVDALTGEGISLGLAEAEAAVHALAMGRPEGYERSWRRVTWRYAALTHLLLAATRPAWARRAVVPAAAALPSVFTAAVNALASPATG